MSTRSARARPRGGRTVDVVVIGAGHSGLAMSHCLAEQAIDHVVLERGEIANSWRTERWDSLKLLTPNWQTRLPGRSYSGDDSDGFMSMPEVIDFIDGYARSAVAPVRTHTEVFSVTADGDRYRVTTTRGTWLARAIVIASGAFAIPNVPSLDAGLPESIHRITTRAYRNPGALDAGRVLVIGASATGVQLAREIHDSGRPVTLAVGEHIRMPRRYRGHDAQWW
ncbi:MAG: NAD(P)-binding domain-containing protein, partial [Gammaproteobacteria bacterium]